MVHPPRLTALCGVCLALSSALNAADASALNPKISVIGDFVGRSGTAGQRDDGFHFRELEIGIQADVDPYARADVFIGGLNDQGGAPEMEEAYVTLLALPGGLQARGGRFRAAFGKLNRVHPHERPQVDSPLVLDQFWGEEGLGSTGIELSRVFSPGDVYTELTYAVLQDFGPGEDPAPVTIQVIDQGTGLPVAVEIPQEPVTPSRRIGNFGHVGKARFYKDLTDATNLEVGVSGALRQPKQTVREGRVVDFDRRRDGAVDVTLRWKPLSQGVYRSGLWRTEILYTDQHRAAVESPVDGSTLEPAARVNRRGGYSSVEVQPAQRWRFGVRGDYAEDPAVRGTDTPHITRAVSPYVTFTLTEFNRFRVQYERRRRPDGAEENLGFFQWTVILGPHGAHAF